MVSITILICIIFSGYISQNNEATNKTNEYNTENKIVRELTSIDDRQFDPFISFLTCYSCILPIDKVIDTVDD